MGKDAPKQVKSGHMPGAAINLITVFLCLNKGSAFTTDLIEAWHENGERGSEAEEHD